MLSWYKSFLAAVVRIETFSGAKSACALRYLFTATTTPMITAVIVSSETMIGDKNSSE